MNFLVIGSGAREHAIVSALNRSPKQPVIYCCGTSINPGISALTRQYWVGDITDVTTISRLAKEWETTIAIIGPEAPLEKGLADALWKESIPTIGPKKKLAEIETSKSFARELMHKYNIAGLPQFKAFHDMTGVSTFLSQLGEENYVIKADGLMSGKGVKVAGDHLFSFNDAMMYCREILKRGQSFIIEEKLVGQEFSLMCFCDGIQVIPMPVVQDHKRAFVDDQGPNTGGMGSYSDVNHSLPFLQDAEVNQALQINQEILRVLSKELHEKYIGILYGSFIATARGVYVIEFNARFGDPEALNVLTILESDFVSICQALVTNSLSPDSVKFAQKATVCKYAVPEGYPDSPKKDVVIDISAVKNKAQLYLSAVHAVDGNIYATGSRTAAYVGVADSIPAAEEIAEKEVCGIAGPLFHRTDIGTEKLIQDRLDAMRKLREEQQ